MKQVLGVRFTRTGKLYYMDPKDFGFKVGDKVIANSAGGLEIGRVVSIQSEEELRNKNPEVEINKIQKPATKYDIQRQKELDANAKLALKRCEALAKEYKIDMKFIGARYTFDGAKLICSFVAEERVDFREIVKELANEYRVRIELRQVGPRDEIKAYDNIGTCGREVCCRTFLPDFESVSIKMAKEQGLQINMQKLSGNCGRFKCCLKYEEDFYKEKLKTLPKMNEIVKYEGETGKVVGIDVLKDRLKLKIGPQGEERFEYVEVKDVKRIKKEEN